MKVDPRNVFVRFRADARRLQTLAPQVHAVLSDSTPLDEMPGWKAL